MLYKSVNQYGKSFRPYMGGFINHLPMVQLALYKMTGDIQRVLDFTTFFIDHFSIDPIKSSYSTMKTIDACVGKKELYESCLDLVRAMIASRGVDEVVKQVLGNYPLGMSSGVFHVLIRLGYAVKGYQMEMESTQEVARALAYYITAYKEAKTFDRKVDPTRFVEAMHLLYHSPTVQKIKRSNSSMGQRLKALYSDGEYMQSGFVIKGAEEEKVRDLLAYLMPLYNATHDIVVLHCITGLHALYMLKDWFDDFEHALDIITTCMTTHCLSINAHDQFHLEHDSTRYSWAELLKKGSASQDVHTIKLVYSCYELFKIGQDDGLKEVALNKIH